MTDAGLPGRADSLLLELASQQATGCLTLSDPDGEQATVWFRDGLVYAVSVPGRRPLLGVRLMSSGALTPEALAEALEVQRTELQGWRLGELLVHLGIVDRTIVESFVTEQVRDQVADLIHWDIAASKFRNGKRTRQGSSPPIEVTDLLDLARQRDSRWAEILPFIGGADSVPVLSTSSDAAPDVVLGPYDWALLCKVDGVRTVSDLADDCGFTVFEAGMVVVGLLDAGLVEIDDDARDNDNIWLSDWTDEQPTDDEVADTVAKVAAALNDMDLGPSSRSPFSARPLATERASLTPAAAVEEPVARRSPFQAAPVVEEQFANVVSLASEREARDEADRVVAERHEAERLAREERARVAAEQAEAQRLQDEQLEAERAETARAACEEQERREAERAETERVAAEQAEAQRLAAEQAEAERLAAEQAEAERVEAERVEAERLAAEQAEAERVEAERVEAKRVAAELAETERVEAVHAESQRLEVERVASEQAEAQQAEAQRLEDERVAAARAEAERIAAEQAEAQRLEAERVEAELLARAEQDRVEAERIAAAQAEAQRFQEEQLEADRAFRAEQERFEAVSREAERIAHEASERVEAERVEASRIEAALVEAVRAERTEREREQAELQSLGMEYPVPGLEISQPMDRHAVNAIFTELALDPPRPPIDDAAEDTEESYDVVATVISEIEHVAAHSFPSDNEDDDVDDVDDDMHVPAAVYSLDDEPFHSHTSQSPVVDGAPTYYQPQSTRDGEPHIVEPEFAPAMAGNAAHSEGADMAALLRELSSLGGGFDPDSGNASGNAAAVGRPMQPGPGEKGGKKKKGFFGR